MLFRSPVAQQLQQLDLERLQKENLLLEAKIASETAKTQEAEYNMLLTRNKALTEMGRARKIDSEADLIDLKFLKEDENVASQEKESEFERRRLHELDMAIIKARTKNEGNMQ